MFVFDEHIILANHLRGIIENYSPLRTTHRHAMDVLCIYCTPYFIRNLPIVSLPLWVPDHLSSFIYTIDLLQLPGYKEAICQARFPASIFPVSISFLSLSWETAISPSDVYCRGVSCPSQII